MIRQFRSKGAKESARASYWNALLSLTDSNGTQHSPLTLSMWTAKQRRNGYFSAFSALFAPRFTIMSSLLDSATAKTVVETKYVNKGTERLE